MIISFTEKHEYFRKSFSSQSRGITTECLKYNDQSTIFALLFSLFDNARTKATGAENIRTVWGTEKTHNAQCEEGSRAVAMADVT